MHNMNILFGAGAWCFGAVIGWLTRYILAFAREVSVNSLSTVIAAIGGAAITTLFGDAKTVLFSWYSIGLACGFFLHVLLYDINATTGAVNYNLSLKNPVKSDLQVRG